MLELGLEELPELVLSVLPFLLFPGRWEAWPAGPESCIDVGVDIDPTSCRTKVEKLSGLNASGPTDLLLFCICCCVSCRWA